MDLTCSHRDGQTMGVDFSGQTTVQEAPTTVLGERQASATPFSNMFHTSLTLSSTWGTSRSIGGPLKVYFQMPNVYSLVLLPGLGKG